MSIALLVVPLACGEGSDAGATATTPSRGRSTDVPAPVPYRAPKIPTRACNGPDVRGGFGVVAHHVTCKRVGEILQTFTTAFSDKNLRKPLVDRGHGWRCFQRLEEDGFPVDLVCWRDSRRQEMIAFSK